MGLGKLFWLDLHRFSSIVAAIGVVIHVALHWKIFRRTLVKFAAKGERRPINSETIMYAACFIAMLTGLVSLFALQGSPPVFGPVVFGPMQGVRHHWIDVHNISALILFALVIHHVGHRQSFMIRQALKQIAAMKNADKMRQ